MAKRWLRAIVAGAALALGAAAMAQEYRPAFQPDRLKGPPPGPANPVPGTTHLSGLPATFDPALLQPLIDRLALWRREAIATEDLSGLRCDASPSPPLWAGHAGLLPEYRGGRAGDRACGCSRSSARRTRDIMRRICTRCTTCGWSIARRCCAERKDGGEPFMLSRD